MSKESLCYEVNAMPEKWDIVPHVLSLGASIIREILKISSQPGVISFAGGLPAPEMFPLEDMKQCAAEIIDTYKSNCMQYSLSMGITPFEILLRSEKPSMARRPRLKIL